MIRDALIFLAYTWAPRIHAMDHTMCHQHAHYNHSREYCMKETRVTMILVMDAGMIAVAAVVQAHDTALVLAFVGRI